MVKTDSLEPAFILTYMLGAFRHCRATSSFPFASSAHSSPPFFLFPFCGLFCSLAEKPRRAEAYFQPCLLVRPGSFPPERGGSGEMGRAYCVHPFLSAGVSWLFSFLHALSLPLPLSFPEPSNTNKNLVLS